MAAKTDVGLVRDNNEDNFQVAADLASGTMRWVNNEVCSLGEKGALLVVADGMGGMNAGEVASGLAIETVKEYFAPQNITTEVMKNRFSIEKFMNSAIIAADERIKQEGKEHPESRGMGTTIVIAWILEGKLYVSWCGDSRAYIYNPQVGLHQITKDHSYVQSLVDKGAISREDAFDFPDSNIITRSLGDSGNKAKPESLFKPYELCDQDIVLLCTDGLCGMIRDNEIEHVLRNNEHDMNSCVDGLIQAACDAEGSDNITVCLCQILQGGNVCNPDVFAETEALLNGPVRMQTKDIYEEDDTGSASNKKKIIIAAVCVLVLCVAGGVYYYFMKKDNPVSPQNKIESVDQPGNTSSSDNPDGEVQPDHSGSDSPAEETGKKDQGSEEKPAPTQGDEKKKDQQQGGDAVDEMKEAAANMASTPKDSNPSEQEESELTPQGQIGQQQEKQSEGSPEIQIGDEVRFKKKTYRVENFHKNGDLNYIVVRYKVKRNDAYEKLSHYFETDIQILQGLNNDKDLKSDEMILVPIPIDKIEKL